MSDANDNSLIRLIFEILLIFFSLVVIVWGAFLIVDYIKVIERDNQRIATVKEIQNALEEFYQDHNYYPGRSQVVSWEDLAFNPEMEPYYNFNDLRDPCLPSEPIPLEGGVYCQFQAVAYLYRGIECEDVCQGYKFILELEAGGKQEFVSKTINDHLK